MLHMMSVDRETLWTWWPFVEVEPRGVVGRDPPTDPKEMDWFVAYDVLRELPVIICKKKKERSKDRSECGLSQKESDIGLSIITGQTMSGCIIRIKPQLNTKFDESHDWFKKLWWM